jgi:hypothetical protein
MCFSDYRRGLVCMIGFIDTFFVQSLLITSNTALSLIYTIYSSPLRTRFLSIY